MEKYYTGEQNQRICRYILGGLACGNTTQTFNFETDPKDVRITHYSWQSQKWLF